MINLIFKRFLNNTLFFLIVMILLTGKGQLMYADIRENTPNSSFLQNSDVTTIAPDYDDDEESHNAGKNCLNSKCHGGNEEHFFVGGTIYRNPKGTSERPDAEIKIIDAKGETITLTSDQLGNIHSKTYMKPPFTIYALYNGREVKMPIEAPHGGCNAKGCHVAGAADRVFISTNDLDLSGVVTETVAGKQEISYTSDIKPILDAKCISCHKKGGQKRDTPLTTYKEVTKPKLATPGDSKSLILRKLNKKSPIGTMWKNLKSISEYTMIRDWIVKYNAQEFSAGGETAVPDATVELLQGDTVQYNALTSAGGNFVLNKVRAGEYTLRVSKDGYATYSQPYQMYQRNVTPLVISLEKN